MRFGRGGPTGMGLAGTPALVDWNGDGREDVVAPSVSTDWEYAAFVYLGG